MGRLVEARPKQNQLHAGSGSANEYLDRVAKYIPGEILAGYVTLQASIQGPPAVWWLPVYVALVVLTPVYLFLMREKGKPWKLHAAIGTVAFVIWTFALHANSKFSPFYALPPEWTYGLPAALLVIFTLVSGALQPR